MPPSKVTLKNKQGQWNAHIITDDETYVPC